MSKIYQPVAPDILSALSGGVNPYTEARQRIKETGDTEYQHVEMGEIEISIKFHITARNNNWYRVSNRFDDFDNYKYKEEEQPYFLESYMPPGPANDWWTIRVQFSSFEAATKYIPIVKERIERIVNDRRK